MFARVPGSSANLGPGFDSLGMSITVYADVGIAGDGTPPPVDDRHPAAVAFRRAGGEGRVWVRSSIPMARGMGFSGAVRVGGVIVAHRQQGDGAPPTRLLDLAAELEGHADNVAASWLGGIVATAGGRAVRIPTPLRPSIVLWLPPSTTSTEESRRRLPPTVTRADAVFNIGRTALLVAALAGGDVDLLRTATEDRLHQDARLAGAGASRLALNAVVEAGAWCSWLSGSGPTIAAMCPPERAHQVVAALPPGGHHKVVAIDTEGTQIHDGLP